MKHLIVQNPYFQSLLEGFRSFLETRGYAQSTCYNLPHQINEFLYFLEKRQIQALSLVGTADLKSFLEHLQNRNNDRMGGRLSPAYLNKYLQALKGFSRYLESFHQIQLSLPFQAFEQQEKALTVLSQAEVEALYQACGRDALGQRDRAMLTIYYGCGLRRSEGEKLQIEDIQLPRDRLYVRPSKNGKDRFVPLSTHIKEDLSQYIEKGRLRLMKRTQHKAFFLSYAGRSLTGQSLNLRLKRLLLLSGIAKDIGLHSLRHAIATHLWQAGMPLKQVAQFLGHQSLDSTQIYTHINPQNEAQSPLTPKGGIRLG